MAQYGPMCVLSMVPCINRQRVQWAARHTQPSPALAAADTGIRISSIIWEYKGQPCRLHIKRTIPSMNGHN